MQKTSNHHKGAVIFYLPANPDNYIYNRAEFKVCSLIQDSDKPLYTEEVKRNCR